MAENRHGHQSQPPPLPPPPQQHQKCPRCDSSDTKFCYYNNYSLSQPRYYCKACRRYWTHGGTLRNVPVGGGCRKTKRRKSLLASAIISSAENQQLSSAALPTRNLRHMILGTACRSSPVGNPFYATGAFLSSMADEQSPSDNPGAMLNVSGGGQFEAKITSMPLIGVRPSQQCLIPPAQLSYICTSSCTSSFISTGGGESNFGPTRFWSCTTDGSDPAASSSWASNLWFGNHSGFNT